MPYFPSLGADKNLAALLTANWRLFPGGRCYPTPVHYDLPAGVLLFLALPSFGVPLALPLVRYFPNCSKCSRFCRARVQYHISVRMSPSLRLISLEEICALLSRILNISLVVRRKVSDIPAK